MDRHTPEQRSKNMRAVKSKGSKEELALAKALWVMGLRYRKNNKTVFGKPDLTFKKYKLAVFVDSEFFHGKDWEIKKHEIKSNQEFWYKKIERNIQRDKEVTAFLEQAGWTVLRFWCNTLKKDTDSCVTQIVAAIQKTKEFSF